MPGHAYWLCAFLVMLGACRDGGGRAREDRQDPPRLDDLDEADRQEVMAGVRAELGKIAREAGPSCDALFGAGDVSRIAGVAVRPAEYFPARFDRDANKLHCHSEWGPAEEAMPLFLSVDCGPERGRRQEALHATVVDHPACEVRVVAPGLPPDVGAALLRHAAAALQKRPDLAPPAPR